MTVEGAVPGKRACVIGAGLGGLALAIRLQSAGVATTLIEARDKPGGCAYAWEREGFIFDGGPGALFDPAGLQALWQLSGRDMAEDVELMPVSPFYRLNWPDGTNFDLSNDQAGLRREIAKLSPEDLAGYEEFLRYAAQVYQDAYLRLGAAPCLDMQSMLKAVPALMRHQAWRSIHSLLSGFFRHEKLRQAFSFETLLMGANPMKASALYAMFHKVEQDGGVWWVKGGTNRLVAAMAAHFERLGGAMRLHDPVVHVHTLGDRATEVETVSGWRARFDAVASNADIVHSYRDLLAESPRGPEMAGRLSRKRFAPGMFVVHFGVEGTWPGIPHNTILFGHRYEDLFKDIFEHGVLPQDLMIRLHHPTVTDPSVAPPGKSTFSAMVPVANTGKLPIDWQQVGPLLEKRILDEIGRRLIPDIYDRIVTRFHYSPRDLALDINAYRGGAFSLEPALSQCGYFRGHNRDARIHNFYLVGAATHPGPGVPGVIASARTTAKLMLEDL